MTEPRQFKRGRRTYTKMGSFREVRVETGKAKPLAPLETPIPLEVDPKTEEGIYSNEATVYRSADEVVVDFAFVSASPPRRRVRSRVVVSHQHARQLSNLLKKAVEEKE